MSAYILIPFGIFFISTMMLFILKGLLIGMIAKSAPATLDRFGGPLIASWRLHRYLEELKAPPGTRLAERLLAYRFWWYLHIGVWLSMMVMTFVFAR